MNNVCITGRLTRDVELRYAGERAVANFTVAVDKNLSKEKKAEFEAAKKPTADFIRVVSWGKQAEVVAQYMKKGSMVGVTGRMETGEYENEAGQKVYTTNVVANTIDFLDSKPSSGSTPVDTGIADFADFQPITDDDIPF